MRPQGTSNTLLPAEQKRRFQSPGRKTMLVMASLSKQRHRHLVTRDDGLALKSHNRTVLSSAPVATTASPDFLRKKPQKRSEKQEKRASIGWSRLCKDRMVCTAV